MLLNEYAAKMGFTCETECKRLWQDGNTTGVARFVARVKLCGHLVAEEEGFSKQEASNKASLAAMGGVMEEAPSDWGQSMRSLVMGKFAELLRPETRSIVFPTVCAGMVCSMPGREPFVVSLGAGTVHMPLVERGECPSEVRLPKGTLRTPRAALFRPMRSRHVRHLSWICPEHQVLPPASPNQTREKNKKNVPFRRGGEPMHPQSIVFGRPACALLTLVLPPCACTADPLRLPCRDVEQARPSFLLYAAALPRSVWRPNQHLCQVSPGHDGLTVPAAPQHHVPPLHLVAAVRRCSLLRGQG